MEKEEKRNLLENFIIPQKVLAFVNAYNPLQEETFGCIVFNDAELRKFFKAYTSLAGDPLSIYLNLLSEYGFNMVVTMSGEPAICVELK